MALTQTAQEQGVRGQEGPPAETATAFDAAVSEFLAYPPSPRLRGTSLQGLSPPRPEPSASLRVNSVEWVLAVDGHGLAPPDAAAVSFAAKHRAPRAGRGRSCQSSSSDGSVRGGSRSAPPLSAYGPFRQESRFRTWR